MERKQKLRNALPEEVQTSIFQEWRILDREISAVENELIEAREEMKVLVVESRKVEVEGVRASREAVSKTHSAEEEAGFDGSEQRCLGELGVMCRSKSLAWGPKFND